MSVETKRKPLLVVSYYTLGTPYEAEAAQLAETLNAVGLRHRIDGIQPRGSWAANDRYKARFCREMVIEHGGQYRLVWLDADARARRWPAALDTLHADVAAHWFERGNAPIGQRRSYQEDLLYFELLASSIYFEDTPATRVLLDLWVSLCEHVPDRPFVDQENLQEAVAALEAVDRLRAVRLGPEYAFISDLSRERYPGVAPVFEQTQASRRHKAAVEGIGPQAQGTGRERFANIEVSGA